MRQFGLDAAGVVTKVGAEVKDFKIGDRVACLKQHALSTSVISPEIFCVKVPDALGFDEAATMLLPYVTVIQSLINVGGLSVGQVMYY
jgi:NADPH:quinone reductase-like Zn-dependent oxidoreductase